MKKLLTLSLSFAMALAMGMTAHAADARTVSEAELTPEQKAVIAAYENNTMEAVDSINVTTEGRAAKASSSGYRGSFYRGSALMWSEDFVEWISDGRKVTSSTAWQDCGFIFPNIVRTHGISKHATSSSSVTYRAKKTIGAGVVTPWGDVTVYNSDFTDFLRANANGDLDVWQ